MNENIEDIEGIGGKYADMLKSAGVTAVSELLSKGGDPKGRSQLAEGSGISEKLILRWVNMSDLFRVNGIAGQRAELLEAAGVDTVRELRHRNAENLAEKMREVNAEKKLVKQVPNATQVADWIEQAKSLQPAVTY